MILLHPKQLEKGFDQTYGIVQVYTIPILIPKLAIMHHLWYV